MPPFATAASTLSLSSGSPVPADPISNVVTLNVGGQIFQTTTQTLALAGPDSLLSSLSSLSSSSPSAIPFIDRDPELFAALLSLLRTGRLPSRAASAFHPDDLLAEARFYSLHHLLISAHSHPSLFDAFSLRRSLLLPLPGRDPPSALAVSPADEADISLLVAHGGKVSSFDPSLRRRTTALTPLPAVDSLAPIGPLAAAGATDFPGLHLLDLRRRGGPVRHVLQWFPHPSVPAAAVQAVGSSSDLLFCSFESFRRNASAILAFDLATFQPVTELARREIYGAELDSAIPATKLNWAPGFNLLMAAGSHSGPSGLSGDIRLWDVRSGEAVWDLKEKVDCFADVTVSDSLSAIFKVGINSGEVFMADIRKLSSEQPWTCIGYGFNPGSGKKEGSGCRIESYGRHVFCSKGGDIEMWTEVLMGSSTKIEDGLDGDRVMKRNLMGGGLQESEGKRINLLGFGGNRMAVSRKDEQCVEVWESSVRG